MSHYIDLETRTLEFSVRIVKLCSFLDEKPGVSRTLSNQLLRSGTSIGANFAESRSAQSSKDFLNKLEIALKEARETKYWLKLLILSEIISETRLNGLLDETEQLIKILVSITKNIKNK